MPSRRSVAVALGLGLAASTLALTSTSPAHAADPVEIQIVGTNDFHGRLLPDRDNPGAAKYAGAVDALRAENPNTVFAAAGDLIGASTFESFITRRQADHRRAQRGGPRRLRRRQPRARPGLRRPRQPRDGALDADGEPRSGGAAWQYIAANIDGAGRRRRHRRVLDHRGRRRHGRLRRRRDRGPAEPGVARTASRASRSTDIVDATNAEAATLTAAGADVVVLLVHEGAADTDSRRCDRPGSAFGRIVNGVNADVDAIVSGHTHLAYNCSVPGGRVADARTPPVVSAGQYGTNLNQLTSRVDPTPARPRPSPTRTCTLRPPTGANYPADPAVAAIVAGGRGRRPKCSGSVELGQIAAAVQPGRPASSGGTDENRGGESTLGNFVAEVQRWATESDDRRWRPDRVHEPGRPARRPDGTAGDGYPEALTYKQAADVQPFANTLVNMRLTGAQIKTVLEQQWQRDATATSRRVRSCGSGTSKGFNYTYDPAAARGRPDHRHVARTATALDADRVLLGDGQLVPGLRRRQLPRLRRRHRQARHRQGRPAGDGRLHGRVRRRRAARARATPSTPSASTCPTATPSLAVAP